MSFPNRCSEPFDGTEYAEPFKTRKGATNLIAREAEWVEEYNQGQRDYALSTGETTTNLVYLDAFQVPGGWQVYWLNVRYTVTPADGEQLELLAV